MQSFFFTAQFNQVTEYVTTIVRALGEDFERTLVRAALSEALLNSIVYGCLRVEASPEDRDPIDFRRQILAAELDADPELGIGVEVRAQEDGDGLVVIRDPGPGFEWRARLEQLADLDASPDSFENLPMGGRGLTIILAGTRRVTWNDAGNEITLRFARATSGTMAKASPAWAEPNAGASAMEALPTSRRPSVLAATSQSHGKILVVDDVEVNRAVLRHMLEREGYAVVLAGDGPTAIHKVRVHRPDVVIMDVNMPCMSGVQALKEMRDLDLLHGTSVILLTAAKFDSDFRSEAIENGAVDFLEKPVSRRELIARLRRIVQMRAAVTIAERKREDLEGSVQNASALMEALLPPARIRAEPGIVESLVCPCEAVGGDLVDFVRISPGAWAVFLVDVAGHGFAAALTASACRATLRSHLIEGASVVAAAGALHARLLDDFDRTGQHAAIALVLVAADAGRVELLNAGCPPIVIWNRQGESSLVRSASPPTGLLDEPRFERSVLALSDISRIAVVSDGAIAPFATPIGTEQALVHLFGTAVGLHGLQLPVARIREQFLALETDRDDASLVWIHL